MSLQTEPAANIWARGLHLGVFGSPVACGDGNVLLDHAAVRGHGQDAEGVLDVHADIVDARQEQRDEGRHEEDAPLEVAPQYDRHEERVNQDETGCVPACMHEGCNTL